MTDLSQPDPLTTLTLTLLCSILQSTTVLLGVFCLEESFSVGICSPEWQEVWFVFLKFEVTRDDIRFIIYYSSLII